MCDDPNALVYLLALISTVCMVSVLALLVVCEPKGMKGGNKE